MLQPRILEVVPLILILLISVFDNYKVASHSRALMKRDVNYPVQTIMNNNVPLASLINPLDWYFDGHCYARCDRSVIKDKNKCKRPPLRRDLCQAKLNIDWCCQEWLINKPFTSWFTDDCRVACFGLAICPYSVCTFCEKKKLQHRCCTDCYKTKSSEPASSAMTINSYEPSPTLMTSNMPATITSDNPITSEPAKPICPDISHRVCKMLDGQPVLCRAVEECYYNCGSGTCRPKLEIEGDCFQGCFHHCNDKCRCVQTPGCHYDPDLDICQTRFERYCANSSFPGNLCGRKGAFYAIGGNLCENKVAKGNCELDIKIVAINFGDGKAVTDAEGIVYEPLQPDMFENPFNISQDVNFPVEKINTSRAADAQLLATALIGNLSSCSEDMPQCVHVKIPTTGWEGDYELGIRTVEGIYEEKNKRRFSIFFADIEIVPELDILMHVEEKFKPLEIFINFKVTQKGMEILLPGHPPKLLKKEIRLSFCKGLCGVDNSFLVSGFHIIKQKEYMPGQINHCEPKFEACDPNKFGVNECRRGGDYYYIDGTMCKMAADGGVCSVHEVSKAINFNGLPGLDSRGIIYEADTHTDYEESEPGLRMARTQLLPITGVTPNEMSLYGSVMYANDMNTSTYPCVWYDLPVCKDGPHELAIRVADDEAEAPADRKFNVYLNWLPVFQEVDPFIMSGGKKGEGVDLSVNFLVANNVKRVIIKGYPYDMELPIAVDKTLQVRFCPSNCSMPVKDRNFKVGAISLVKFEHSPPDNKTCEAHGGDPCACRYDGNCEFDVVLSKCVGKNRVCITSCADRNAKLCRRGGEQYFYASSGTVCHSPVETGLCGDPHTLLAVNFGDDVKKHTDVHGIHFVEDEDLEFEDPNNCKEIFSGASVFAYQGIPPPDLDLYNRFLYGATDRGTDKCTVYHLPTAGDGFYELSIKTGEIWHDMLRKRVLSFKLNDQYIVREFEPARYRFIPNAYDLNVNFKIFDNKLKMEGHPESPISNPNKTLPFAFCFGTCSWPDIDVSWHIGAFSLIKFKKEIPCSDYKDNPCACAAEKRCALVGSSGNCVEKRNACKIVKAKGTKECRRVGEHVFYVEDGVICPGNVDSGYCEIEKQLIAGNMGGKALVDSRGIVFTRSQDIMYDDPGMNTKFYSHPTIDTEGVPDSDKDLYAYGIYGDAGISRNCTSFTIPTDGDGYYELSLRQQDIEIKSTWIFDIMINGQNIVQYFEPSHVRTSYNGFEMNVLFKITGTKFQMSGYPESEITSADKSLPLKFCHGHDCGWALHHWANPAFSVVKFITDDSNLCSTANDDPCGCRNKQHCEFDTVTGECVSKFDGCKPVEAPGEECRRAGTYQYYVNAGRVCVNLVPSGDCDVDRYMFGINFYGDAHVDFHGIPFEADDGSHKLEDPDGVATNSMSDKNNLGYPKQDLKLYQTTIYGDVRKVKTTNCTTLQIPLGGDGYYELSLRAGEHYFSTPLSRFFSVKFNGQYVVREIDLAQIRPTPYAFNMNVNFRIVGSQTKFQMAGHPEIDYTTGSQIPLEFCFGTCGHANWQLSAVSVVKFTRKLPCNFYDNDPCACRENGVCEYNVDTGSCLERKAGNRRTACAAVELEKRTCHRGGEHVFYSFGGMVCNNPTEFGNCRWKSIILSANFGPGSLDHVGIDRIQLKKDTPADEDRYGFITDAEVSHSIEGIPTEHHVVYQKYSYGDKDRSADHAGKCVTYNVGVTVGYFELSIKLTEPETLGKFKRTFSVKFNNKYVVREFDISHYRPKPKAMHLYVNYQVFNGKKKLQLEGQSMSDVVNYDDEETTLEFCFGNCTFPDVDLRWVVSGFSIVKFQDGCSKRDGDACECRKFDPICEYNANTDQCTDRPTACAEFEKKLKQKYPNECLRGGDHIFYAYAGVVCPVPRASGHCTLDKVMMAINLGVNAWEHTDINGIEFRRWNSAPVDDPDDVKTQGLTKLPVAGVPVSDLNLYKSYWFGKNQPGASCVTYKVPTEDDGEYQISIKTGELYYTVAEKRAFSFRFGGLVIVQAYEPAKYRLPPKAFDLNVNFRVTNEGKKMQMRGHPESDIVRPDRKIPLQFCFGMCTKTTYDMNWLISAFSVVKFTDDQATASFDTDV